MQVKKWLLMREICGHAAVINRINLHKPDPLELHYVAKFFYHQWLAGTSDIPFLREEGTGNEVLCRKPLDNRCLC